MNASDLTAAEQTQLVHARQMGGYLIDNLPDSDRQVWDGLVDYGLAEIGGEGAQRRYALTPAGDQLAAQIAAR